MLAQPDPSTFQVLPWREEQPGDRPDVLRHPDARRLPVVRRPAVTCSSAADARRRRPGLHLLHASRDRVLPAQGPARRRRGRPRRSTAAATSTTRRTSSGTTSAATAITMLERMGICVEFSHHEVAPGQQEIDLRYADALTTADNLMTFRLVVKEVALSQGVYASFMPKPFTEQPGSAMHTHLSLFEGDRNAFHDASDRLQLSKVGRAFIAGLLHARARSSPRSPTSGSTPTSGSAAAARRRRTSAGDTTTAPRWSGSRCTSRRRATPPASRSARPTRACNPYLAFAVLLAAGLKGIEESYELPAGAEDDVWALTDAGAPRDGHRAAAPDPARGDQRDGAAPSSSPRRSASTCSTSSCATSAPSGRSYRRQVTPFERARYLPVL